MQGAKLARVTLYLGLVFLTLSVGAHAGSGRVDFLQLNVDTGVTNIQAGNLKVGHASALGAAAGADFTSAQAGTTPARATASAIAELRARSVRNSSLKSYLHPMRIV